MIFTSLRIVAGSQGRRATGRRSPASTRPGRTQPACPAMPRQTFGHRSPADKRSCHRRAQISPCPPEANRMEIIHHLWEVSCRRSSIGPSVRHPRSAVRPTHLRIKPVSYVPLSSGRAAATRPRAAATGTRRPGPSGDRRLTSGLALPRPLRPGGRGFRSRAPSRGARRRRGRANVAGKRRLGHGTAEAASPRVTKPPVSHDRTNPCARPPGALRAPARGRPVSGPAAPYTRRASGNEPWRRASPPIGIDLIVRQKTIPSRLVITSKPLRDFQIDGSSNEIHRMISI